MIAGALAALVAAGGVTACSTAPSPAPRLTPTWRPVSLPVPPGRRAVVGDLTVCDGAAYRLWASRDGMSWREVRLPVAIASGAQRRLLVAAGGGRLAVVADDGAGVRMWLAAEPTVR